MRLGDSPVPCVVGLSASPRGAVKGGCGPMTQAGNGIILSLEESYNGFFYRFFSQINISDLLPASRRSPVLQCDVIMIREVWAFPWSLEQRPQ